MQNLITIFSEETLYALGWTVIHSLWQAALVALLIGIILIPLQRVGPQYRYLLSFTGLLAILSMSVVTFSYLYTTPFSQETILIAGEFSQGTANTTVNQWEQFSLWFSGYFNQHLPLIVILWILGLLFFTLRLVGGLGYLSYLKKNHVAPITEVWQTKVDAIAKSIRLSKPVQVLESAIVEVPMVLGYFKPVILMPVGAFNNLSPEQVEAVLAHEMAHIVRNDFLYNILQSLVETLFYFNPAVWWLSSVVRTERENCCDDVAISVCGNSLQYAKTLVALQEMNLRAPALSIPFGKSKGQLLNRVKRILNQPNHKSRIMEKLFATLLLISAIVLVAFSEAESFEHIPDTKANATEFEVIVESINHLSKDSIPDAPKRSKQRIIKKEDEQEIEMEVEDGVITRLKIDGEEIPSTRFGEFEELTSKMMDEMANIPAPPVPPLPPDAPEPPKPPKAPGALEPPAPPKAPKAPKALKKVTVEKDDAGNTIILMQENLSEEPVEIIIQKEGEKIILNGEIVDAEKFEWIRGEEPAMGRKFLLKDDKLHIESFPENGKQYRFYTDEEVPEMEVFKLRKLEAEELKSVEKELQKELLHLQSVKGIKKAELEEQQRILKQEMEILKAEHALAQNERLRIKSDAHVFSGVYPNLTVRRGFPQKLETELLKDGLIEDKNNFSFEMTDKKLKVDGKKQPKHLFEKYKTIYESISGKPITGDTKWEIEKTFKEEY